jgi:hypothetical protein
MPLTKKGEEIMASMMKTYPTEKKAKEVFYASENKGTISGVHPGGKKKRTMRDHMKTVKGM